MKQVYPILLIFIFSVFHVKAQVSHNVDSLLALEKNTGLSAEKVRLLRDIGFNYTTRSPETAKTYFQKAIQVGEQIKELKYTTSVYSQLAILHTNLGDMSNSDFYLEETRKRATVQNSNDTWASYYQAATLIYKKRKRFVEAKGFAEKGLRYNQLTGKKDNIAGAHLNLANCLTELKQFKEAVKHYYNALKIFDEIKNERGQAYCLNNLGLILKELGQYQESIKNATRALQLKEKIKDEKGMASSNQLIAENYLGLNQPERALLYLNKSTPIFRKMSQKFDLVNDFHLRARGYRLLKDSISARHYYDLAISEGKDLDASGLLLRLKKERTALAQSTAAETNRNRYNTAINELRSARARKDTTVIMDNLDFLAQNAYDKADFKNAYDYREEFHNLNTKIFGPEVLRQMKEVEAQYEMQKKENSIALLQKDKLLATTKLKKQRIALFSSITLLVLILLLTYLIINRNRVVQKDRRRQSLTKMRNGIARDLHDDIGSTLSSIQIISELIKKHSITNPKLAMAASNISDLSGKVADGMREIVWATNPENDRILALVERMHQFTSEILQPSEINFSFNQRIKDGQETISPKTRKNILMIFKEALNNARKYSGTERIEIYFVQGKRHLKIQIKDFGKGFKMDEVVKGNGLVNMQKRAAEINATLIITSDHGVHISLIVPNSHEKGID